ncbi:putative Receptor-like protein EIX2 [Cocos nucifera]|uniref:Putative Receptor-like protein EIX2 n=1 Tax=Cocos nucifera TaxID=13894 RepID=A0A8K0N572_COCNU|nr:putative Receptor-like protein EIX2 [Cocos nucifera]
MCGVESSLTVLGLGKLLPKLPPILSKIELRGQSIGWSLTVKVPASDKYRYILLLHLAATNKFMDLKGTQLLLLFFAFLCADQVRKLRGDSIPGCIPVERNALLGFKEGLKDPTNRLSSWVGDDCCTWEGVACDNRTGHVVELDLRNPHQFSDIGNLLLEDNKWSLGGELRPSLLGLKHLNYLDLSMNKFGRIRIPEFMGSFRRLRYLNLSYAGLGGPIPQQLGNLSSLQYLDLSYNYYYYYDGNPGFLTIDNVLWISNLSSLRYLVELDLRNPHSFEDYKKWSLGGELRPSLLGLKYLNYLDLSMNKFGRIRIPEFMGSFRRLRYLNLSYAGLGGPIPQQLGNLSSLQYLDLSYNYYYYYDGNPGFLTIDNVLWISNLSSLRYLNMTDVQFKEGGARWLQAINMLPSIIEVRLQECGINTIPLSLPHVNFTSLSVLDLFYNSINSTIPGWLFNISSLEYLHLSYNFIWGIIPPAIKNLSSLQYLDLRDNNFWGIIPPAIKNLASLKVLDLSHNWFLEGNISVLLEGLCKLQYVGLSGINISKNLHEFDEVFTSGCIKNSLETLDMSDNQISGHLPDWLGDFRKLQTLDLSNNSISGPIPASLGRLAELVALYLRGNFLEGVVSEEQFANFTKLKYLDLSRNQFILNLTSDWIPPFQLHGLFIGSCKLGPRFPAWLQMHKNITDLDMSSTGISDAIPDWFWRSFSQMWWLDISSNGITGSVPDLTEFINLEYLNLSSNHFEGPLPNFNSSNLWMLDLSNNSFSEVIPFDIGKSMPNMGYLRYGALDLSKNLLSGELPDCWNHSSFIFVIDFSSNSLSGSIPPSICSLPFLESLHLSDNNLSGELPLSLKSCRRLNTLDLGRNGFIGTVPTWIGESLLSLKILRLRSNKFVGNIPPNLSNLSALQILDLANNNLSGTIPSSFGNFTAMKASKEIYGTILENDTSYNENMQVMIKGRDIEYGKLLPLVISMDLSNNNLSETIPEELGSLFGLMSLNLSGNHLTGEITENISALRQLESLDFSRNNLSGGIPSSMIALTFLSYLNLSYNNFSGRIPSGNQFQTFIDSSIYAGNPDLCGFPLIQKCKDNGINQDPNAVEEDEQNDNAINEEGFEMKWLNMSTGIGFPVGFWIVFGPLLFNNKWREAYFQLIDQAYDMVYMALAVIFARFKGHKIAAA